MIKPGSVYALGSENRHLLLGIHDQFFICIFSDPFFILFIYLFIPLVVI